MTDYGTCQVNEGTSGGAVQCNQPAVATVRNGLASYRACERHAKLMEMTGGGTVERD
jgi:hypothetical protein